MAVFSEKCKIVGLAHPLVEYPMLTRLCGDLFKRVAAMMRPTPPACTECGEPCWRVVEEVTPKVVRGYDECSNPDCGERRWWAC